MKQLIISLFLSSLIGIVDAQITITDLDIKMGDVTTLHSDTISSILIDLNDTGTSKTWDFSSLLSHSLTTEKYEAPTTGLHYQQFPNANFVTRYSDFSGTTYNYYSKTSLSFDVIGYVGADSIPQHYNFNIMKFPSSYGTSDSSVTSLIGFQDKYHNGNGWFPNIDSVRMRIIWRTTSKIDADGELKLPIGKYNVVRKVRSYLVEIHGEMYESGKWVYMNDTIVDEYDLDSSVSFQTPTSDIAFWSENSKILSPVLAFELDSSKTRNSGRINWYKGIANTIHTINEDNERFQFYPNPTRGEVHFRAQMDFTRPINYRVYSTLGKIESTGTILQEKSILLSDVIPGIYFIVLEIDEDEVETHKIVLD